LFLFVSPTESAEDCFTFYLPASTKNQKKKSTKDRRKKILPPNVFVPVNVFTLLPFYFKTLCGNFLGNCNYLFGLKQGKAWERTRKELQDGGKEIR